MRREQETAMADPYSEKGRKYNGFAAARQAAITAAMK